MIQKRPLDPRRLRSRPPRGFGWLDHRLLRQGYLARCSPPATALYCLLVCAGDAHGLSFYSDQNLAQILQLQSAALRGARAELMALELIACQRPLYQVLALPESAPAAPRPPRRGTPAAPPSTHLAAPLRPPTEARVTPAVGQDLRAMVKASLQKGGAQ